MGQIKSVESSSTVGLLGDNDLAFMRAWGNKLWFTEPVVCARHFRRCACGREKHQIQEFRTIDGTEVFMGLHNVVALSE
jgi:hypothetical protein